MNGTVLHITSADLWGGAEAQVLFQLEALQRRGINVELLLFNNGVAFEKYQNVGLRCSVVQEKMGIVALIRNAIPLSKKIKPQIIVTHGYKENIVGFVLSLVTGARLITTFHGLTENYIGLKRIKMAVYLFLSQLIWRFYSKRIVTVSNRLARDLGVSENVKLRVVWNVIDCKRDVQKGEEVFVKRPAVLFMGRLVRVKRCDLAIRAVKALLESGTDVSLYVAGEGPLKNELIRLVADLGIEENVKFLGFREDVKNLIANCDVFLVSSDSEGIPTVLLEAIFENKPIVSTRVGGIEEVVAVFSDYPIELVNPNNDLALSDAIRNMIKAKSTVEDVNLTREKITQHFSAEQAAIKLEKIYSELL